MTHQSQANDEYIPTQEEIDWAIQFDENQRRQLAEKQKV